ncbi:MAG: helix-turn-helix transcriptional regulator [Pirellulales bacterium]|nr:helix-turn-helix transcriptional regulator [Pirellulales bacterium]
MRQLRLKVGLTVKQAAEASGFSDDAWYKLERGERWVGSEQRLHDIGRALGVAAWQLLAPAEQLPEGGIGVASGAAETPAIPAGN